MSVQGCDDEFVNDSRTRRWVLADWTVPLPTVRSSSRHGPGTAGVVVPDAATELVGASGVGAEGDVAAWVGDCDATGVGADGDDGAGVGHSDATVDVEGS